MSDPSSARDNHEYVWICMNKASCVIDTITHVIVAFVRGFLVNDSKAHYLRGHRDINAFGFLIARGVLTMGFVSCGTRDDTDPRSLPETPTSAGATVTSETAPQKRQPCDDDEGLPVETSDSSVEARLKAAGVSDALVCELGVRADGTGYGLDGRATTFAQREDFAVMIAQTCAEVASGYRSWNRRSTTTSPRGHR